MIFCYLGGPGTSTPRNDIIQILTKRARAHGTTHRAAWAEWKTNNNNNDENAYKSKMCTVDPLMMMTNERSRDEVEERKPLHSVRIGVILFNKICKIELKKEKCVCVCAAAEWI